MYLSESILDSSHQPIEMMAECLERVIIEQEETLR